MTARFRVAARVGCKRGLATALPDEWPSCFRHESGADIQNPAYRPSGVLTAVRCDLSNRLRKIVILAAFLLWAGPAALAAELALPMDSKAVLGYLDMMIDWRHRATSIETPYSLPQELLFRNTLQQHTTKAARASFDFASALAVIIEENAAPEAPKPVVAPTAANQRQQRGIGQAVIRIQQRIQKLQGEEMEAKTPIERKNIEGLIRLEQEHLNLLKTIARTVGSADEDNQTLTEKIQQLSGAIPDEESEQHKPEGQAAIVAAPAAPAATSGIAGLIGRIYGFVRERSAVSRQLAETQALYEANRKYSQAVRTAVQAIMAQGDDIRAAGQVTENPAVPPATATAPPTAAAAVPVKPPPSYDDLVLQMKQYSAVAVAISRVNMTLRTCTNDLNDWIDLLSQHIRDLLSMLAWRVAMLALLIFGIIGLSMVAQRATKRYVLDDRRQTQLRTVRRGVAAIAIAITVFIGFFTDLGSLATFAGLFTAGMAVALQTPILSVISYFNFFGPFGIRLGDRLTVANVTGKVIQITPLRFSMMELRESDLGYLPSGRVVGFANSVLFQPAPFFRQTNSTNFVWSEISLTLDPSIDYEEAFKKLSAVVQKVYGRHSDVIKKQEAAFQSLTRFKAEVSVPQMYLKITGNGIVMVIRYAVQREHEREVNLEMNSELLAAIKRDPKLKFVNIN